jgi:hypothetical protein
VNPTLRRTPGSHEAAAAERWFLERGLPSVLTSRGRWRRLWPRCAPMLVAWAAVETCLLGVYFISDGNEVLIEGTPTTRQWAILALLAVALPLAALSGWLVSRISSGRIRAAAAAAALAFAVACGVIESGPVQLTRDAIILGLVLLLTGCGVGSVLAWAVRMTFEHLSTVGTLAIRALPIVLLTALVFFNTYVWLMAANINGERLTLAIVFLMGIAGAFVVSKTVERVRPLLRSTASLPEGSQSLVNTPFAILPGPASGSPLTRAERLNVVFLLATSQLIEILVVAGVGATMYLVLGVIILTPPLLKEWTHHQDMTTTVLGMTFPAPDSLIHMCLFLGALTFMYISARAVDDDEYRGMFLDPLIDDLHTALAARNRYLGSIADESEDLSGKRYGEVLLVEVGESGPQATVYNSFGLNDCPAELWSALDPQAIAQEHGVAAALLNGPRYWLMNAIEKRAEGPQQRMTFGGIEMIRQATVQLSSMNPAPYTVNEVTRDTVFVFNAGEEIYELIDPDGERWVMQTFSQVADPTLSRADLAGLAGRLTLPEGWSYQPRVLTETLRVDTTARPARVTQDDLTNSYSFEFD